ncbi:glycosyltransferase family 2 protein [Comamonas aquatica]|uniref:glycosyltransferase family 2 protein n=1 Tax=Comamonas aquatica TaxID=225991 RepID=UPI002446DBAB|nr:glycosyltransferase family 2 protein [Comamonas aquatica]MDH1380541.1 glycosyltransferase family 2 protein [Comamonas aquatica]MDH1640355.1 glycosyltransferase family 2 protein [Comamonas aquatica]
MATYNGARFIRAQVDSILEQLGPEDELVVCDDGSRDQTLSILVDYHDARIKIHRNPDQLGHVRNFERAISLAEGDYIFLSDQDDVWTPDRVRLMIDSMNAAPEAFLVASNFDLIDAQDQEVGQFRKLGRVKPFRWLQVASIFAGRSPYFGCTFLLRREALRYFMPIPRGVESHDIWFALVASMLGGVVNLPVATLKHRVHDSNVTARKRRALTVILKSRLVFARALVLRMPLFFGFTK